MWLFLSLVLFCHIFLVQDITFSRDREKVGSLGAVLNHFNDLSLSTFS